MTEDEAKTKWCPFVRVTGAGNARDTEWHTNRPSHLEVGDKHFDRCIGSACMAWRADFTQIGIEEASVAEYESKGWSISGWEQNYNLPKQILMKKEQPTGYCGLAGKS